MSTEFWLNNLESAKWVFVVAYVVATIGVTIGVHWEGEHFAKPKQSLGHRLVVWSLAADTLFTILIFATDGWISQIQKSQIAEAVNRAAKAEETLVAYRKQRYLTQGQKDRIARVTKDFPSIPFVAFTALE